MSCSLSVTYDVTSTLRWCIASSIYGLAPLHPLLFSVLLVVPGRALASVSPDGERSVNFLCYNGLILYTSFVMKVKDLVILLDDRVYSDHHVFVILLAII